jgi:hypothetical protein
MMECFSSDYGICIKSETSTWFIFPIERNHGTRNKRIEARLVITLDNPLKYFSLTIPTTLGYGKLESFFPKVGIIMPVDTIMVPWNYKLYYKL